MNSESIFSQMTLEDKISLCEGASFWETKAYKQYGILSMFACDGPSGLRKQGQGSGVDMLGLNESQSAKCFPAAITTANSWDPELIHKVGIAIGQEAREQQVGVVEEAFECDYDAHHVLARRAAEQGAVLLKNEDDLLPLSDDIKIAVIGHMAKQMRYQGAGSSHVNARQLDPPVDYLPNALYALGCDERGDTTEELIIEAVNAAKDAKAVIAFAGLPDRYESEGFDREDMKMSQGLQGRCIAVTVENTGTCAGAEVVQLYVAVSQESVHRPVRELKGFQKVFLEPGESMELTGKDLCCPCFEKW